MKKSVKICFMFLVLLVTSLSLISAAGNETNQTTCINDCTLGTKKCSGNYAQTCGNYDADNCREWNTGTICSAGTICSNGACINQTIPPTNSSSGNLSSLGITTRIMQFFKNLF